MNLFLNLLVLFLVVLWIALIVWTYQDARRRMTDDFLIGCATFAAVIFPFVGAMVYAILRPPEFLEDAHERELEVRAAELRVRQLDEQSCPNCDYPIEPTYLRCPSCKARVKDPCDSCKKPLDPRWSICPFCETPVQRAAPQGRQGQRGRQAQQQGGRGRAQQQQQRPQQKPGQQRPQPKPQQRGRIAAARGPQPNAAQRQAPGGQRREGGDERPRPAPAP